MASMTSGRPRMTSAAPPTAPTRPPSCGSAPERKPRAAPTRSSTMAARSIGFTRRSSHRSAGRGSDGPPARVSGPAIRSGRPRTSSGRSRRRRRRPCSVPGSRSPRSMRVALSWARSMHATSPGPCPSRRVMVNVPVAPGDHDRVEGVARLDAAPPERREDDVPAVDGRGDRIQADRVDVELARLRGDQGRAAGAGVDVRLARDVGDRLVRAGDDRRPWRSARRIGRGAAIGRRGRSRRRSCCRRPRRPRSARRPASRRVVVMPRRRARPAEVPAPCPGWTSVDGRFPASADVAGARRGGQSRRRRHIPRRAHRDRPGSGDHPP